MRYFPRAFCHRILLNTVHGMFKSATITSVPAAGVGGQMQCLVSARECGEAETLCVTHGSRYHVAPAGNVVSHSVITPSSLFFQESRVTPGRAAVWGQPGKHEMQSQNNSSIPLRSLKGILPLAYCSWRPVNACLLRLPKVGCCHVSAVKQRELSHFASRKRYLAGSISLITAQIEHFSYEFCVFSFLT